MLKMCEQLSCEEELWPLLLSSAAREAIVKEKKFELISAVRENESYFEKWYKNRVFLDNLKRFDVDTQKLRNVSKIRSGSMASKTSNENKIVYSTSRTATGRLTITQGLNFLVLPKETRKCILTDFSDSNVYSIDFTSLEPRVALWAASESVSREDVYEEVMQMCDIKDRKVAKLATLSTLYGAGIHRLAKTVGSQRKAKQLTERVSHYFKVKELVQELDSCANEKGIVKNFFGRPLHEATANKRLRLNHFVQSTAAELAITMFADLCSKFPNVKPLLVIHDALIVEVRKHNESDFLESCKNIRHEGFWFPAKAEILDT